MSPDPLPAAALARRTDPAGLGFATTADLTPLEGMVGQERATAAVEFAIEMGRPGYNLFALGPEGIGKSTLVLDALQRHAAAAPVAEDLIYVHDFERPQRPRAIMLPAGRGIALAEAMERLIAELRVAMPAAFDSDEYRTRRDAIDEAFTEQRDAILATFEQRARAAGLALVRTPVGIGLTAARNGEGIGPEEFARLPEVEQATIRKALEGLEDELGAILARIRRSEREKRGQVADLDRTVAASVVGHLLTDVRDSFSGIAPVMAWLADLEADVIAHAGEFVAASGDGGSTIPAALRSALGTDAISFRRYSVNVLVDRRGESGAPVVREDNPTIANLVGRVEYVSTLGALTTDFTLIRAGALHRANGGYLMLEARKVLTMPFAWESLKRALRSGEVRIETPAQALGLVPTVTLEPAPVPLQTKVALVGDRTLYYLLCALDPEFLELFKVEADFEDELDRSTDTEALYARLIATMVAQAGLRALDAAAVARVIDEAVRRARDATKVSTQMRSLVDLLAEADVIAGHAGRVSIAADDVAAALAARERRASRLKERTREAVARDIIRIETTGDAVGQVNGLSVVQLGDLDFATPSRITASARLGTGDVVDIEREVELGGPIHSKGVLILSGFISGRYARESPLSLHASLVFEQSYGGVEGDSASLAEACALLSAIGEVPIRQSIAVTGSIDQFGGVQAVGGVNEKIEAFHDVCAGRGLTGDQGVIIPAANVSHLMLRDEVVASVLAGRFSVWAIDSVDAAMEILTRLASGTRGDDGRFASGTLNARVEDRLLDFAERARAHAKAQ
jgi:lon-related putative ATP-dependent protease